MIYGKITPTLNLTTETIRRNPNGFNKKQKEVLDYITEYVRENNYSPTQKEIQEHFGFKSLGSVQDYIKYLKDGGYLTNDTHSVRGLMPATVQQNTEEIPLLGSIAAGIPIEPLRTQT